MLIRAQPRQEMLKSKVVRRTLISLHRSQYPRFPARIPVGIELPDENGETLQKTAPGFIICEQARQAL